MTIERNELLALVDKIRGGTRNGWGYGRDECADFIARLAAKPDEEGVRLLLTNLTGFVAGLRQHEIDPELREEILNKITTIKIALSTTGAPKP